MSTSHVQERREQGAVKRLSALTIIIAVTVAICVIAFIGWSMLYNERTVQTLDEVAPLSPPLGTP